MVKRLVILDYDGVIVDSFSNVHESYINICKKFGRNCPEDLEVFRKIYGDSSKELKQNLGFSSEEISRASYEFKSEIFSKKPKLFIGIKEVLLELKKDSKLVIITSNYQEYVDRNLKEFGLYGLFDAVIGREEKGEKNKTKKIMKILGDFDFNEDEIVFIGDRNLDFIEGSEAGIKNILLVDYGWGYNLDKIPEYERKFVIKEPSDILNAIRNLEDFNKNIKSITVSN